MTALTVPQLAHMIDYAFLKLHGDPAGLERVCQEAREWHMWMVAIHPADIERCLGLLQGSAVRVGATVGFPLGQNTLRVKEFEASDALERGAQELDMTINVRALQRASRDGDAKLVKAEVQSFARLCRQAGAVSKVILETCYLNAGEKRLGCQLCLDAGVDFIKTSSGFTSQGATVEDVRFIKQMAGERAGVKAAGGILTLSDARALIEAGASRLGTSHGVDILKDLEREMQVFAS
jgi:deoxyribose-phosphate aldolase